MKEGVVDPYTNPEETANIVASQFGSTNPYNIKSESLINISGEGNLIGPGSFVPVSVVPVSVVPISVVHESDVPLSVLPVSDVPVTVVPVIAPDLSNNNLS